METQVNASPDSPISSSKKWYQAKLLSVGITPCGYIAIGIAPMGVISIGIAPMGVISIGTVAMGAIAAGFVSMGMVTFGEVSMSYFGGHRGMKPHSAPPAQETPPKESGSVHQHPSH